MTAVSPDRTGSGGSAPAAPPRSILTKKTSAVEAEFRAALLNAGLAVPEGLEDGVGRAAGRRYGVYRNNIAVGLREALETGFPAVAKLIGAENFAMAAGIFLRQSPPRSSLMMHYGSGFPEFLSGLAPLASIGYLADVARLELALRESYHSADSTGLDPTLLQGLSEEALMAARLEIAPSVRVLRSPWPLLSIYRFTMTQGAPKPQAQAEDVLVLRPDFDPEPHVLPTGGADFIAALSTGHSFGEALEAAGEEFDLGAVLTLLLTSGALVALT